MSAQTRDQVEKALAAHMADECPDSFLMHWVICASGAHIERPTETLFISSAGAVTPMHAALGLTRFLQMDLEAAYSA
jgi:hypothetical protein